MKPSRQRTPKGKRPSFPDKPGEDATEHQLLAAFNPVVLSAGCYRAAPDYCHLPEHPEILQFYFWYVAGGIGKVKVDGQWITIHEGDIFVLAPGQHYQEERTDPDAPSFIYFSHIDPFGQPSPRLVAALKRILPMRAACLSRSRAEAAFTALEEVYNAQSRLREIRLKMAALEVLELLFASLHMEQKRAPSWHKALIRRARCFIEDHATDAITPDDIAREVNVSTSHLFAIFRGGMECSPIQYQTELRLRIARKGLLSGRSVTDAAEEAGFSSLHYFSRLFKCRFGMPPSQFARQGKSKSGDPAAP